MILFLTFKVLSSFCILEGFYLRFMFKSKRLRMMYFFYLQVSVLSKNNKSLHDVNTYRDIYPCGAHLTYT